MVEASARRAPSPLDPGKSESTYLFYSSESVRLSGPPDERIFWWMNEPVFEDAMNNLWLIWEHILALINLFQI